MSAEIETDNEDEFAAELYNRLQEEARYQESLEDITAWSRGREDLSPRSLKNHSARQGCPTWKFRMKICKRCKCKQQDYQHPKL